MRRDIHKNPSSLLSFLFRPQQALISHHQLHRNLQLSDQRRSARNHALRTAYTVSTHFKKPTDLLASINMARSKASPCPGKPKAKPPTPDASSPVVQRLLAKEQRKIEAAYATTTSNHPAQPVRKFPGQKKGVAYKFTIPKKGPRQELEILPRKAGQKRKARSPESEDEVEQDSAVSAVKWRKRDDEVGSAKNGGKKKANMMEALEDAALDVAEMEMEKRKENVKANAKEKPKSGNAKANAKPQQKVEAEPRHKIAASSP